MTNKSTNPLIQNNFVLKKLEVGLIRVHRLDLAHQLTAVGVGAAHEARDRGAKGHLRLALDVRVAWLP